MSSAEPILVVDDLRVSFPTEGGLVRAVDGVSFEADAGRTLGIVGESGSGKSVTAMAVMGLVGRPRGQVSGRILFEGRDLLAGSADDHRRVRGDGMAMVFQDPLSSLHPMYRIGWQVVEAIRAHRPVPGPQARARAAELLHLVGLPDPRRALQAYPHELSGGMRQRVMIAMALANEPKLLIADEPTTALDVRVQAQILQLVQRLQAELGMAIVFITHDLGVIAETADDIAVMYAGRVVERAPAAELFDAPSHPYTWGLLGSIPRLDGPRGERLRPISGRPPGLTDRPPGCSFHPRCPYAEEAHRLRQPELAPLERDGGHQAACLLAEEERRRIWAQLRVGHAMREATEEDVRAIHATPIVEVRDLVRHFPSRRGTWRRRGDAVRAVDGISFDVRRGEALGIVGESGSGKSTTARLLAALIEPTSGQVRMEGLDVAGRRGAAQARLRREVQMIFQDPYGSLNSRKTVGAIVAEPLVVHGLLPGRAARRRRVLELMEQVGLGPEHVGRRPHEFSGGQRQRIGIARALALEPKLIIADEPVSALDVSVQAQILNLLSDLRRDLGLTLVLIAHDLSVVRHMCDRIVVMYRGKAVEIADAETLYTAPAHPYTRALLAAVPVPEPGGRSPDALPGPEVDDVAGR